MQKLIVRNFGPIKELDLEIKDLMLFIGEQATGKSTVAKLVYFFKSLREKLIEYLFEEDNNIPFNVNDQGAENRLRHKFWTDDIGWGLNKYFRIATPGHSELFYMLKPGRWLKLTTSSNGNQPASVDFINSINSKTGDSNTYDELDEICRQIIAFRKKYYGRDKALMSESEYRIVEFEKKNRINEIETLIDSFFGEDKETLFVPAGRTLMATLSERLPSYGLYMVMEEFRERTLKLKPAFQNYFVKSSNTRFENLKAY